MCRSPRELQGQEEAIAPWIVSYCGCIQKGNVQAWTGHQEETRDLEDHICGVVAHIEIVELVSIKTEVFFEAADICIGDVCLVCLLVIQLHC